MREVWVLFMLSGMFAWLASALSADGWSRQSIYQVMTDRFARTDGSTTHPCDVHIGEYCGGTWQGIIQKLDYIQGMGFTAIWISPIIKNLEGRAFEGTSFHGFWGTDAYAVNDHFGTEDDLKQLSDELHRRGMYLMVDVVTNHMGQIAKPNEVDYSLFNPFSHRGYFHDYCQIDYNNQFSPSQQVCWVGSIDVVLADLRSEDEVVRTMWSDWAREITPKYGIDGYRVDSAKHMDKPFHTIFEEAAGVYTMGEVFNGDPNFLLDYMNYMSGVTNFASYYWLLRAFGTAPGSFSELRSGVDQLKSSGQNTAYLGNFLSNHDVDTWESANSDVTLNKNALAFLTNMDGIPIVFEGHEHRFGGDWTQGRRAVWFSNYDTDSELYKWIAMLNKHRNHVVNSDPGYVSYKAHVILEDGAILAMKKGSVVSVYSALGTIFTDYDVTVPNTGYRPNQEVVDIVTCTTLKAGSAGRLVARIQKGLPAIYRPLEELRGSGICSDAGSPTTGTATSGVPSTTFATSTTTADSCPATGTIVPVTFNHLVETVVGDEIYVVGSVRGLGNWNPTSGVHLNADQYTSSNPLWSGTVDLEASAVFQYKFVRIDAGGTVHWENDPNRSATLDACPTPTTLSSRWR